MVAASRAALMCRPVHQLLAFAVFSAMGWGWTTTTSRSGHELKPS